MDTVSEPWTEARREEQRGEIAARIGALHTEVAELRRETGDQINRASVRNDVAHAALLVKVDHMLAGVAELSTLVAVHVAAPGHTGGSEQAELEWHSRLLRWGVYLLVVVGAVLLGAILQNSHWLPGGGGGP